MKYFPSKEELQKAVNLAEASKTFSSRTELYKEIAGTFGVNQNTLIARTKEMGIIINTLPAKIGHTKGTKVSPKSRADKFSEYTTLQEIRKDLPEQFVHFLDKAEKGSMKALVALKCINCSCFQRREITLCTQTDCSLYPIRPFQGSLG